MKFEWDPRKAGLNRAKHGVSFEDATTAFDDPGYLVKDDERHSRAGEIRKWLIGLTRFSGKLVTVIFTERGGSYRLISARPASRKERMLYEKFLHVKG